jgi:ankyrin repeat protein
VLENLLIAVDDKKRTFLHIAAKNGNIEIIKTTIDALKVDHKNMMQNILMAVNDDGETFLNLAAQTGNSELIENIHNSLKKNFSPQFINDTELFSLKSRIIYLKNSIHNTIINIYDEIYDLYYEIF